MFIDKQEAPDMKKNSFLVSPSGTDIQKLSDSTLCVWLGLVDDSCSVCLRQLFRSSQE